MEIAHDLRLGHCGHYELRVELDGEPVTAAVFAVERPIIQ